MSELLKTVLVDDPEFGIVAQVVDEDGIFAGFDVPREDIEALADESGLEGRERNLLDIRTSQFYADAVHRGFWERRMAREEDSGANERGVIRSDEQSDEGVRDDIARRTMRYPENQGGNDE